MLQLIEVKANFLYIIYMIIVMVAEIKHTNVCYDYDNYCLQLLATIIKSL